MKRLLKILFKLILILAIIARVSYGGYYGYQRYQKREQAKATLISRPDVERAKGGTSVSPGHHSLAYFKRLLDEKYPDVYSTTYETPHAGKIGSNVMIPGQVVAPSCDFNKRKPTDTDTVTPQGLTIAGKYLLITVYDLTHIYRPVIYCLDKKTGEYLKTIQVSGAPYLDGAAYDPVTKNIWVTGSQDDSSALVSFPLEKLEKYSYSKKRQPVRYDNVITLPIVERTSCVAYYGNQLFVGFFDTDGQKQTASYSIARSGNLKGTITNDQIKAITG